MSTSKILAILSASLALVSADYSIANFQATDIYIPTSSHYVSFQVSQPGAVWELGGDAVANCTISWTDDVPTCFTPCANGEYSGAYYARLCPGSFEGASNLAIEILETWFYKAPDAANASVAFQSGKSGYTCSRGAQTQVCWTTSKTSAELDYSVNAYEEIDECD